MGVGGAGPPQTLARAHMGWTAITVQVRSARPIKARSTSSQAQAKQPGGSGTSTRGLEGGTSVSLSLSVTSTLHRTGSTAGRRAGDQGVKSGSSCPALSSRTRRVPAGATHRHGGAPGRCSGLSGRAPRRTQPAAPLGRRPPQLQPFPSPELPRPLPSAHKTFFFFKLPGRTRVVQWEAWKPRQTAAGAMREPMGARAGPGAGPERQGGRMGRRAGRAALRAGGLQEGRANMQVTAGDGAGAG